VLSEVITASSRAFAGQPRRSPSIKTAAINMHISLAQGLAFLVGAKEPACAIQNGVGKEFISKILIGNRFHVKLGILSFL